MLDTGYGHGHGPMKIALVLNDNFGMWRFRRGLIETLVSKGVTVHVITPPGDFTARIESLGARHISVPMGRFVGPLNDLVTVVRLFRIFRRERYAIVHNMQIKPTIFGGVAARLARVPRITALIPGLGYPFFVVDPTVCQRMLGRVVIALLRLACRLSDKLWFQNPDDLAFFVRSGLVSPDKAVLIRGSGVDVDEFSVRAVDEGRLGPLRHELKLETARRVVVMVVARLIWSKGIREFMTAAERVAERERDVVFVLAGPFEPGHPDAVPASYFTRIPPNVRVVTGFRNDIRELLSLADIVTLPSYFREGVPRVLLEALALGKPIVTTDGPGCREVVDHGRNGLLVPARDAGSLASALLELLSDPGVRTEFGAWSRRKAESEFDERVVVRKVMTHLYGLS
jgi:N,N'-diacetylbacillosaminyl-diphospho-undecaprenol alpha-1,3-N-acetylgalactosaminyltransferase